MDRIKRTDKELAKEIVNYLKEQKGNISRGKMAKALNIHQNTIDKWLGIGLLFMNDCPPFVYERAETVGIIRLTT